MWVPYYPTQKYGLESEALLSDMTNNLLIVIIVAKNINDASDGACHSCAAKLDLRQCVTNLESHMSTAYYQPPPTSPSIDEDTESDVQNSPDEESGCEPLSLQSDEAEFMLTGSEGSEVTETNVAEFLDETPGSTWSIPNMLTSNLGDQQPNVELAKFLSRPVLIKTHIWAQTDSFTTTTTWNPWYLFFNSTPIKSKINNYSFIHCKLKLKFVINASPFYSGAMYFAYSPLEALNGTTIVADASGGELVPYSQRPGVWILPQTCQGGEITLPFFYHKNWLDISSATDVQNMGLITPCLYASLVSATGIVGTSVVINVYAWAEDVKLHAPTTKLALQSSEFDYKPSQIASATAAAAGSLSRIPIIGPYMKATSSVAASFSKVASALGFTNVPNMSIVNSFKPAGFPHNTTCEVSVPTDRAAVDPKNEVTLDPRTVGLDGTDELSLAHICARESFIGTAILSSTDAVDALTLVSRVTPALCFSTNSADPSKPYQFTPMSYVADMFKYWRGDIIFRFKFICTRFHKGRVRITFDPTNDISINVPDYTSVFNEIVDIGAEQDIEVRIPYSQALTFLRVNTITGNYNFSGTALAPDSYSNGLITMRVVNPLSGPVANTAIPVLVYVRAAENIEFCNPYSGSSTITKTPYALQSKEVEYTVGVKQVVAGNSATVPDPNRYLVHFGEKITSFRPLLHRFMRQYAIQSDSISTGSTLVIYSHRTSRRLKYGGYDSLAYWTAQKTLVVGTAKYNYVRNNLHQLVSLLFIGQRGSINHSFNVENPASNLGNIISQLVCHKLDTTITVSSQFSATDTNTSTAPSNQAWVYNSYFKEPYSGVALTDQRVQPALSVNFPYYSNYNFQFVNPAYSDSGSSVDGTDSDNILMQFTVPKVTNTSFVTTHVWSSYGPDYNFFFFLNCPSLYVYTVPVA